MSMRWMRAMMLGAAVLAAMPAAAHEDLTGGWLLQGELIGVGSGQHLVQVPKLKLEQTSLTIPAPITGYP